MFSFDYLSVLWVSERNNIEWYSAIACMFTGEGDDIVLNGDYDVAGLHRTVSLIFQ